MVLLQNTAEGGAAGTTVTTANSGGASGDAFTQIVGTVAFSSIAAHGSLAYTTNTAASYPNHSISSAGPMATRMYFRCSAAATASAIVLVNATSSTAWMARVFVSTAGRLTVQNSAGASVLTATNSLSAIGYDTWIRLELVTVPATSGTNGTIRFAYYVGDSTTPVQLMESVGNANTGTLPGAFARYGRFSGTFANPIYFDDLAASDQSTFIGPVAAAPEVHTTAGTATSKASASASTSSVRVSAGSATSKALASALTSTGRASAGTATAKAAASSTSKNNRASAGTAAARASASGVTTTTRASVGAASSRASAAGSTSSSRITSGNAAAKASATGQTTSTHTTAGTATSRASASAVTTQEQPEVHVTAGIASSRASASAVTSAERISTGTALSRARAYASTTSIRTSTGTAVATARAAAATATIHTSLGTATAQGAAFADATTSRVSAGTANSRAYATAVTRHGDDLRDITVTWRPLTAKQIRATATSQSLAGRAVTSQLIARLEAATTHVSASTSTLTVTLED